MTRDFCACNVAINQRYTAVFAFTDQEHISCCHFGLWFKLLESSRMRTFSDLSRTEELFLVILSCPMLYVIG